MQGPHLVLLTLTLLILDRQDRNIWLKWRKQRGSRRGTTVAGLPGLRQQALQGLSHYDQ